MTTGELAVDAAAEIILDSHYVVALVGAGLSAESGIPTFRGAGGLWTRIGEPSWNGYQDLLRDPVGWWRNQLDPESDPARTEFRAAIDTAEPNPGHKALVELERMDILKMTITQNVDNLHVRAGSNRLIEIHGNRTKVRCIGCEARWSRDAFDYENLPPPLSRVRRPRQGRHCDVRRADSPERNRSLLCSDGPLRLHDSLRHLGHCVYPAAAFPQAVSERGGYVIEANPNPTPLSALADVALRGPTGTMLPRLVDRLR